MAGLREKFGDILRKVVLALLLVGVAAIAISGVARAAEFVVKARTVADRKAVFATIEASDETATRARIGGTVVEHVP